ncbi:hypothetical protein HDV01_007424 [Terramyces sp. JEL0728]|nr:hypothetical protein HDV01_007424 [Terramyces sp. JEL0728]
MFLLLTAVRAQTGSTFKVAGTVKDDCSYVIQSVQTAFLANCGASSLLDISNANPVKMCTRQCTLNIQSLDLGDCGSSTVQYSGGATSLASLYSVGLLNTQVYCATDKNNDLCFYAANLASNSCSQCKLLVANIIANSGADKGTVAIVQGGANLNCKVTLTTAQTASLATNTATANITTTTTLNVPASYPYTVPNSADILTVALLFPLTAFNILVF